MAVWELLIVQSVMVLLQGGGRAQIDPLVAFVLEDFPGFAKNRYIRASSLKQRLKLWLLRHRQYGLLKAAFGMKR